MVTDRKICTYTEEKGYCDCEKCEKVRLEVIDREEAIITCDGKYEMSVWGEHVARWWGGIYYPYNIWTKNMSNAYHKRIRQGRTIYAGHWPECEETLTEHETYLYHKQYKLIR